MRKILYLLMILTIISFFGCSQKVEIPNPNLAIVVVVDQMIPDHITRYDSLYVYGLRRLIDSGIVYTNAYHDHANTSTGVGHATIATGVYPARHGIIDNNWYNRTTGQNCYCCYDPEFEVLGNDSIDGRSPNNLLVSTVGDLLKETSPESKVVSFASKDRSSIFMGGKHADAAYWYDYQTGNYVTSYYYSDTVPVWLDEFNQNGHKDVYFNQYWHKFGSENVMKLAREDDFPGEYSDSQRVFARLITGNSDHPDAAYYQELFNTPFADKMGLAFVRRLVESIGLGQDSIPDLLWVGCSSSDPIGHRYGPYSQEALDYYLRLDDYLGFMLDTLNMYVGEGNYSVILTSDHGVMPLPEYAHTIGITQAKRIPYKQVHTSIDSILNEVGAEYHLDSSHFNTSSKAIYLTSKNEADKDSYHALLQNIQTELEKLPYIEKVYIAPDLSSTNPLSGFAGLYQKSFLPDRSPDIFIHYKEYTLVSSSTSGTTHGSPYSYDTNVPIIVYGKGLRHEMRADSVTTLSIAPTLGDLLNLKNKQGFVAKSLLGK